MSTGRPAELRAEVPPSLLEQFQRQTERLSSRYFVQDARSGDPVPFAMKGHHEEVLRRIHAGYQNHAVLEGGHTRMDTFFILLMLDKCIQQDGYSCALFGSSASAAQKAVLDQIHFIARNSPLVKEQLAGGLEALGEDGCRFQNGSRLTFQEPGYTSVSRFNLLTDASHLAEEEPRKFSDTISSLGNGNQYGINVLLASPYGYENGFSRLLRRSMELEAGHRLDLFDWAPLFVAWHQESANAIEDPGEMARYSPDARQAAYLDEAQASAGVRLSPAQRAWWVSQYQNGFADSLLSMQARCPMTVEEALAPHSDGLLLRKEMVALREQGRLADGLEQLSGMPSFVFWNFGGSCSMTSLIVVQLRPDQPGDYRVIYAHQDRGGGLHDCLAALDQLELNVLHHFLPEEEPLAQDAIYVAGKNSYQRALQAAGIENTMVIDRINDKGAGFLASSVFASRVQISKSHAMPLFIALYGVQKAYDPSRAVVKDELKQTGSAFTHNFFYECFELAARVVQVKMLDPESGVFAENGSMNRLSGAHVF